MKPPVRPDTRVIEAVREVGVFCLTLAELSTRAALAER